MTDRIIPIVRASLPPARDLAALPQGELFDLRRRRVRRLAVGQITDAFLGTDAMIEDFEGYNGRI